MNAAGNVRSSVMIVGEHDLIQSSACAADSTDDDDDRHHAQRHCEGAKAIKAADKRPLNCARGSVVVRQERMSGLGVALVRKRCQFIAGAAATGGSAHKDAFTDKIVDVA